MEMKVNLPATHEVSSRGKTVTVDMSKLDADMIAKLALHGLTQKVADAAAGAKKAAGEDASDETIADTGYQLMDAVAKRLESGDWGAERGGGAASDPLDKYRLQVMRDIMKTPKGEALKAAHDKIPSEDQKARREYLLSIAAKNSAIVDKEAQKRKDAQSVKVDGLEL